MSTNFALVYIALCLLGFANAFPYHRFDFAVARRQMLSTTIAAPVTSPTTITTTHTIQTANGPMNQTCILSFTPVDNQVQEVRNCSIVAPSSGISDTPPSQSLSASMSVAPTSQAAFSLPGRTMQVLPVGIGVFGSVTAITIIIVAVVTVERVRYRKAFRERRLAQQNAMMQYGNNFRGKV